MPADSELVERVVASTALTSRDAVRVIDDVVAYYAEPVDSFVRRRHSALKTYGMRNDEIFARIREELTGRVVAPPDLSERQLRRIVYG